MKGAPLPPHTASGKKGLQVKPSPSTAKDSSVTRQNAVFVGGVIRSNSRNIMGREGVKTDIKKDASDLKSARSLSKGKRPQTAAVHGSSESMKHGLGSRKDSVRSLKNQGSHKNLHA